MSNLLVQNIKHTNNTTAQTIDTSGRTTVSIMNNDSTFRSDSGAVTLNMVQGLTKVWAVGDQDSAQDLKDSFNVSTMNDLSEGIIDFNFANNMANANYSASGNGRNDAGGNSIFCRLSDITTSLIKTYWLTPSSLNDTEHACLQINGDLA